MITTPEKRRIYARKKTEIWEEYPVSIEEFIDSPDYLDAYNECWPTIRQDVIDLFSGDYYEAVFDEAIGCGKSYKVSIILSYLAYKLLCLKDPQDYFGLAKGTDISIINMSRTGKQAKKVIFGEMKNRVENSPWFQRYAAPDDTIRSEYRFPKNVQIFPGNSKATTALGYAVFAAVMDEASWYSKNGDPQQAQEVFYTIQRRINNRGLFMKRKEFHGIIITISNPSWEGDFTELKYKESLTDPKIFGRKRAVWESKPQEWNGKRYWSGETFELEGTLIPIELKRDFEKDVILAWRDHGAVTGKTKDPYFAEYDKVLSAIGGLNPVRADSSYKKWFRGKGRYKYNCHFDLAYKRDSAGFAMSHKKKNGKIKIDLMLKITPGKRKELQLSDLRKIPIYLKEDLGFNIKMMSFDGWQSVDSRQKLKKKGFKTELLSIDSSLAVYDTFKDLLYDGEISYYEFQSFLDEMGTLQLIKGSKVDHPAGGSKDVADAVAGSVWWTRKDRVWTNESFGIVHA